MMVRDSKPANPVSDAGNGIESGVAQPGVRLRAERYAEVTNTGDVDAALKGAHELWWGEADNDAEYWCLTEAGQVVRITGLNQDRVFVYEKDDPDLPELLFYVLDDEEIARFFGKDALDAHRASRV